MEKANAATINVLTNKDLYLCTFAYIKNKKIVEIFEMHKKPRT